MYIQKIRLYPVVTTLMLQRKPKETMTHLFIIKDQTQPLLKEIPKIKIDSIAINSNIKVKQAHILITDTIIYHLAVVIQLICTAQASHTMERFLCYFFFTNRTKLQFLFVIDQWSDYSWINWIYYSKVKIIIAHDDDRNIYNTHENDKYWACPFNKDWNHKDRVHYDNSQQTYAPKQLLTLKLSSTAIDFYIFPAYLTIMIIFITRHMLQKLGKLHLLSFYFLIIKSYSSLDSQIVFTTLQHILQTQNCNQKAQNEQFIRIKKRYVDKQLLILCFYNNQVLFEFKFQKMLGPQYQRLFQIQQRLTGKQIFQRIKQNSDNPLHRIVAKLKREFTQYETQYDNPIMEYQISSLDRILSFDNKLGPILDALQKENLLLRKQLANLENHLSQSVGICQNILNENNELKVIIKKKNEDINKIIETIAGNQAQEADEFQEKNRLLMQQNSILLKHLEEIKKQHDRYNDSIKEKDVERLSFQKKFEQSKKQLTESISRQRELYRKISLLEQNIYQNTEQIYSLQQNKQNLTFQNNQLKNQILLFKGKNESINTQGIKRQMESQYQPIIQQHKLFKKERNQIMRQAEKAKLENQKLQEYIVELQRKVNKLGGDLELTQSLLVEKKEQLSRVISAQNKLQSRLSDLKQQSNRLRAQKQTSNIYTMNKQKRLQEQIQRLRNSLQDKSREIQHRMKQIKDSMHNLLQSKDSQIRNLRQQAMQLQRIIDRR